MKTMFTYYINVWKVHIYHIYLHQQELVLAKMLKQGPCKLCHPQMYKKYTVYYTLQTATLQTKLTFLRVDSTLCIKIQLKNVCTQPPSSNFPSVIMSKNCTEILIFNLNAFKMYARKYSKMFTYIGACIKEKPKLQKCTKKCACKLK